MTTPTMTLLREQLGGVLEAARVQGNVLTGVAVHRAKSRNGRRYSERAQRDLVSLADGAKVFLDHSDASPVSRGRVRTVRDLVGYLRAPHLSQGTVRANLHLLDTAHRGFLKSVAEENPDVVGLSISAEGEVRRRDGEHVVERVRKLRSVDVVSEPATTSSLFEAVQGRRIRSPVELTEADQRLVESAVRWGCLPR